MRLSQALGFLHRRDEGLDLLPIQVRCEGFVCSVAVGQAGEAIGSGHLRSFEGPLMATLSLPDGPRDIRDRGVAQPRRTTEMLSDVATLPIVRRLCPHTLA